MDELPQFFNVLKGDMSVVGPRPERRFFIDQIVQRAPHYVRLHKITPRNHFLGTSKIWVCRKCK
jgi:lipopolysaccharide/colanic/teichoic acid biosynthesis glycosyltransferase